MVSLITLLGGIETKALTVDHPVASDSYHWAGIGLKAETAS